MLIAASTNHTLVEKNDVKFTLCLFQGSGNVAADKGGSPVLKAVAEHVPKARTLRDLVSAIIQSVTDGSGGLQARSRFKLRAQCAEEGFECTF